MSFTLPRSTVSASFPGVLPPRRGGDANHAGGSFMLKQNVRDHGGSFAAMVKASGTTPVTMGDVLGSRIELDLGDVFPEKCSKKIAQRVDEEDDTQQSVHGPHRHHPVWNIACHVATAVLFVGILANEGVVKELSSKGREKGREHGELEFEYSVTTVVVASSLFGVVLGVIECALEGESPLPCFAIRPTLKVMPIALLETTSELLLFLGLRYMPADTILLLEQSQLLMLVVASWLILKRNYSATQSLSLIIVFTSMIQYIGARDLQTEIPCNKTEDDGLIGSRLQRHIMLGTSCMLLYSLARTLANVFSEKYFKGGELAPLHVQKSRIELANLLVSSVYCVLIEPWATGEKLVYEHPYYFFTGWSWWTVLVVVIMTARAWFAAHVIIILDAIMKQMGYCLALQIAYIELLLIGHCPHTSRLDYNVVVSGFDASLAIVSFIVAGRYFQRQRLLEEQLQRASQVECETEMCNTARADA